MKETIDKKDVWKMFNQISPTYDRINRILSLGMDQRWRKKMLEFLPKENNQCVLDIASGTGDQVISLMDYSPLIDEIYGLDPAEKMLEIAKEKIKNKYYRSKVSFLQGKAEDLPFEEGVFDTITISFGIRNVENLAKAFSEMKRVMKKKGRLIILEFSLPENEKIKKAHLFYLRHILPYVGGIFSRSKASYQYLNDTIETFPFGQKMIDLLEENGFKDVSAHPLLFGAVSIYVAVL